MKMMLRDLSTNKYIYKAWCNSTSAGSSFVDSGGIFPKFNPLQFEKWPTPSWSLTKLKNNPFCISEPNCRRLLLYTYSLFHTFAQPSNFYTAPIRTIIPSLHYYLITRNKQDKHTHIVTRILHWIYSGISHMQHIIVYPYQKLSPWA